MFFWESNYSFVNIGTKMVPIIITFKIIIKYTQNIF